MLKACEDGLAVPRSPLLGITEGSHEFLMSPAFGADSPVLLPQLCLFGTILHLMLLCKYTRRRSSGLNHVQHVAMKSDKQQMVDQQQSRDEGIRCSWNIMLKIFHGACSSSRVDTKGTPHALGMLLRHVALVTVGDQCSKQTIGVVLDMF